MVSVSARRGARLAAELETEPREVERRLGAALAAAVCILVTIGLADVLAGRWAGALAGRAARVEALLAEQQALVPRLILAARQDGAHASAALAGPLARFAANRLALAEGDAARGIPRSGDGPLARFMFEAPHHLAGAMAGLEAALSRGRALAPAALRRLEDGLAQARDLQAAEAAAATRAVRRINDAFAVGWLAALAAIAFWLLRPLIARVAAQMRRLIAAHDAVQHAAFHDPLTGLANRDSLTLQLDLAMGDPGLDGQIVGVVEIELARFEAETGGRGRAAAEAALVETAARLAEICRDDDIAARLDGPVFAVVFTDVLDDGELVTRAQAVARRLAEPVAAAGAMLCLDPTVGAAAATAGRMLAEQAMAAAGRARARARMRGLGAAEVSGSAEVLRAVEAGRASDASKHAAQPVEKAPGATFRGRRRAARRASGVPMPPAFVEPRLTPVVELATGRVWAFMLAPAPAASGGHAAVPGDIAPDVPGGDAGPAPGAGPAEGGEVAAGTVSPTRQAWVSGWATGVSSGRMAAFERMAAWRARGIAPPVLAVPMSGADLRWPGAADRLALELDATGLAAAEVMAVVPAALLTGTPDIAVHDALEAVVRLGARLALGGLEAARCMPIAFGTPAISPDCLLLRAESLAPADLGAGSRFGRAAALAARALDLALVAEGVATEDAGLHMLRRGAALGMGPAFGEALDTAAAERLLAERGGAEGLRRTARWRRAG